MTCERYREAISARIDREDPGIPLEVLDAHLAACAACRAWQEQAEDLRRQARLQAAEPAPDLAAAILMRIGELPRAAAGRAPSRARQLARLALVLLAAAQAGLALPALVLGAWHGTPVHAARELASFDMALAVGFLVAARRPVRARGLLPVVAALVACLAVTAALDVAAGRVPALEETVHLLDIVGLALLWLLARRPGGGSPATSLPAGTGRPRATEGG